MIDSSETAVPTTSLEVRERLVTALKLTLVGPGAGDARLVRPQREGRRLEAPREVRDGLHVRGNVPVSRDRRERAGLASSFETF